MGTSRLCVAALLAAVIAVASSHNHEHHHEHAPSLCGLEPESGSCSGYETRWYYNVRAGTCLRFMYTGCDGNLNNFVSADHCMSVCQHHTQDEEQKQEQEQEVKEEEKETESQEEGPSMKVVKTIENDESDVDLSRMHITDANDLATLEQLMQQDNLQVEEVVPAEEQDEAAEEQNTEEKKDEDEGPKMKIVKTIENDESDIDFDRLHITDENDLATLEQLLQQDNMGVEEIVPAEEQEAAEDQGTEEKEPQPQEEEGPSMKVVKTIENDESDVDLSRMHITDANDLATLEQLMQQDNLQVEEVIPAEQEEEAGEEQAAEEKKPEAENDEGPKMKIVKTIENDESDIDFDRLHITDENDLATLEQLLQQDNMGVEEIVPADEEETVEDQEPQKKETESQEEEGPSMKVVKTIENDESDVDLSRMHITDANDLATLEQLMQQDNLQVEEVVPAEEQEEAAEEQEAEEKNSQEEEGPKMKIVKTIENDESDVDFDKLHITDENDLATLEQLLQQDNMGVEEIVPADEEAEEKESQPQDEEGPSMKVVKTIENDESDVDLSRMHITDANDLATLEQLMQQDNLQVEEVVPAEEQEEIEENKPEENDEGPKMKIVKTIENDESDIDFDRLHITDENDLATLEQLLQQDNMGVEEVVPADEEEEAEDQKSEEKETESQEEEGPSMKVVKTIENDESDVDLSRMHITDANDLATLEQLMQQDNLQVEEVVPAEEQEEAAEEQEAEEKNSQEEEGPKMKIVKTIENDESDIDFDRLHITDENDLATLEQLLQQDNMGVEEIVPAEEEETNEKDAHPGMDIVRTEEDDGDVDLERLHITDSNDKATLEQLLQQDNMAVEEVIPVEEKSAEKENDENLAYKRLNELRERFSKPNWFQKRPVMFFSKQQVVEEEETEEETTTFLHPRAAAAQPPCCLHPVDAGPCQANVMQWYYDPKLKTCVTFTYGGCGGNKNRFDTIGDCLRKCGGITRAAPLPIVNEAPPPPTNMMMDPYKAILSHMSPRMKPFLAIFANMRKEQQEQQQEQSAHTQELPRRPDPGVIRVLINRGRPMPGYEREMPPLPRSFEAPPMPMPVPPAMHMYKHHATSNTYSPQYRKEVVMAPQSHDNRFQTHATPNNKVTLVQVFVNKQGKRGGKGWYESHEQFGKSASNEGSMRGRKPWKKDYRRRGGKSWTPAPKPYMPQHSHDNMGMRAQPKPFPHPFAPVKPWWARFGRPVTYVEDDEDDHTEFMEQFMQTTTYPPDYPKWDSLQVARPSHEHEKERLRLLNEQAEERIQEHKQEQEQEQEQDVVYEQEQEESTEPGYECMLPLEAGPCKALVEKWYYNKETKQCDKFYFGGCRGNGNNFDTEEECQRTCKVAPVAQDNTTPYPDDVVVVTELVYENKEYQEAPEDKGTKKEEEVEQPVTPDPMQPVEKETVKEISEPVQEEELVVEEESTEVKSEEPEVGRLRMSDEMEYIIIITAMCLVGVIVVILVSFTVAHIYSKVKKSKKERVIEAVVASNPTYGTSDYPRLVYYGHTIVPPAPHPDVPDVHTLNKIPVDLKDEV